MSHMNNTAMLVLQEKLEQQQQAHQQVLMQKQDPSDPEFDHSVPRPMASNDSEPPMGITTVIQPGISPAGTTTSMTSPMELRYR